MIRFVTPSNKIYLYNIQIAGVREIYSNKKYISIKHSAINTKV
jgi:hypothetical protein